MTVNAKKISGSSQTVTKGVVLQHGTILRSVDLPKMFQLLKIKDASCTQAVDIAKRKITSIQQELGHSIQPETIVNALTIGFKTMLKIQLEPDKLTTAEQELAIRLCKRKYETTEWIFEEKLS